MRNQAVNRRDFITLLRVAAAAWPVAGRAQQPTMPVVGFLRVTSQADSLNLVTAFRQGLREAGFVEGQNVTIEYRWAEGQNDRLPALAEDLVRRQVAVVVGHSNAAQAAKAASSTTQVIFVVGADPIRTGLVANLNRPGGNVTGVTFPTVDVISKRLSQLHDLAPTAELIGVLLDPNDMEVGVQLREAEAAAATIGRSLLGVKAASPGEFNAAFASIVRPASARCLSAAARSSPHSVNGWRCCPRAMPSRPAIRSASLRWQAAMSYGPSQADACRHRALVAMPLGSSRAERDRRPAESIRHHQVQAGHQSRNCGDARNCRSHRVAEGARRRGDRTAPGHLLHLVTAGFGTSRQIRKAENLRVGIDAKPDICGRASQPNLRRMPRFGHPP
jgi:putative ABC transport system substrate-binding protein